MRIGIVEAVTQRDKGPYLTVTVDATRVRDVILLQIAGHRAHVAKGSRVILLEVDGNDTEIYALAVDLAPLADPVALALLSSLQEIRNSTEALRAAFVAHGHTGVTAGAATSGPPSNASSVSQPVPQAAGTEITEGI
jgi:hypothetical protein